MNNEYAVILVESTSLALRIEKLAASNGVASKLILVPRHLSSDCGVCVRISAGDIEKIRSLLKQNAILDPVIEVI
jgi:hypothetical protein